MWRVKLQTNVGGIRVWRVAWDGERNVEERVRVGGEAAFGWAPGRERVAPPGCLGLTSACDSPPSSSAIRSPKKDGEKKDIRWSGEKEAKGRRRRVQTICCCLIWFICWICCRWCWIFLCCFCFSVSANLTTNSCCESWMATKQTITRQSGLVEGEGEMDFSSGGDLTWYLYLAFNSSMAI